MEKYGDWREFADTVGQPKESVQHREYTWNRMVQVGEIVKVSLIGEESDCDESLRKRDPAIELDWNNP